MMQCCTAARRPAAACLHAALVDIAHRRCSLAAAAVGFESGQGPSLGPNIRITAGPVQRSKPSALKPAEPPASSPLLAVRATAESEQIASGTPYAKELRLLSHVLRNATPGDPLSVCEQIERFGEDVLQHAGQWLKVAGAQKATVLAAALRDVPRGGSVLEIGCYCGYSAIRMAMALPGARIVTLEVDPAHVVIARNMVAFAGLAHMIDVWTGHSKDLLPRLPDRYGGVDKFKLCAVFMDQRGTRYDDDLAVIERLGLLLPEAVVIADNVLKPGSPLFLWRLQRGPTYDTHIVTVREFAMPSEDWMSVSMLRLPLDGSGLEQVVAEQEEEEEAYEEHRCSASLGSSSGPADLVQLQWETDRIRAQATRAGQGVSYAQWSSFADQMRTRMAPFGIKATIDAVDLQEGRLLFPRPLPPPGAMRAARLHAQRGGDSCAGSTEAVAAE